MEFNFNAWAELAARDPAAFEAQRQALLEAFIRTFPPERQTKMRALQAQIEQVRQQADTPLAACDQIAELMWSSFAGDDGLIASLARVKQRLLQTQKELPPDVPNNVIPLPFRRVDPPGGQS